MKSRVEALDDGGNLVPSQSVDASRLGSPLVHVGPVPSRPPADSPAWFGKAEPSVSPLVEGRAADPKALAKLDDADRVTGHTESVSKVLTPVDRCEQNTYMTSAHRVRWFARFPGHTEDWMPRTHGMQGGGFGWDVKCSCGWESRTGGATEASVKRDIWIHKLLSKEDA